MTNALEDLDIRVLALFCRRVDAVIPASRAAARTAVRRRAALLLRRRRRLRHALGTTLAAGITAGGLHDDAADRAERTAQVAARPETTTATASERPTPTAVASPAPPGPWTRDAAAGIDREAADPGALHAAGRLHVYATSAAHCVDGLCLALRVPRFESAGPAEPGRLRGDAMPDKPAWVADDDDAVWAPAVAPVGSRYVLWFAATSGRAGDGRVKCLGAAVAVSPAGPFVPDTEPLHCSPGYWAIDPYPVAHDGSLTLLWRQDGPGHETGAIVSARLEPGGLALAEPSTTLLVGEQPWEEGYPQDTPGIGPVENPAMARHPATGEWLLTWSANRWETRHYATGLARCAGPRGPCQRLGGAAWLRTNYEPGFATSVELGGAGGLSFSAGPDGRLYAVLHAYEGTGSFPAPRLAWAYRVDAVGAAGDYRLVDIAGNQTAPVSVKRT